jgi:hypothetical protein
MANPKFNADYYAALKAGKAGTTARIAANRAAAAARRAAAVKPRSGRPLIADASDSECFSELRYSPKAGGVFATFRMARSISTIWIERPRHPGLMTISVADSTKNFVERQVLGDARYRVATALVRQ